MKTINIMTLQQLQEKVAEVLTDRDKGNYRYDYEDVCGYNLRDFLQDFSVGENPIIGLELVSKKVEDQSSSYDWTDDLYIYVLKNEEDIYYELKIREQSYNGTDILHFKEVQKKTKEIVIYE